MSHCGVRLAIKLLKVKALTKLVPEVNTRGSAV